MKWEVNWAPFRVAPTGKNADQPRSLNGPEGLGDRLRSAAFAEIQARDAFLWACEHFTDAPERLKKAWKLLARSEQKHLDWLLNRMQELQVPVEERTVSDHLWHSLQACQSAREFALYMANAERWGQKAGEKFQAAFAKKDPITAGIFKRIVEEEYAHIRIAHLFFPEDSDDDSAEVKQSTERSTASPL